MESIIFKVGDVVTGHLVKRGEVWKVTDEAIHVRQVVTINGHMGFEYIKYHFNPTHHTQTPITSLKLTK